MIKTAKNESSLASPATTSIVNKNNNSHSSHHNNNNCGKTKAPFKKVFSTSQLQTNQKNPQNRCSITSINSFNMLNHDNNQLSSSLPGMYQKFEEERNEQQRGLSSQHDHHHKSTDRLKTLPLKSTTTNQRAVIKNSSPLSTNNRILKNIPIGAIEPSLIGSLSSYLSDLRHFDSEKFIKEIELMLKYFEDAVKKDKLELLNGSCNILIETIAVNCSRLRDAYLHLQQVQLRLQILSNIHMDNDDNNDDDGDGCGNENNSTSLVYDSPTLTKNASPIIEATNELNKNLSDLVKWSDEIYLRQQIRHFDSESEVRTHQPISTELIDTGTKISRLVFISFKNLVKAYKNMEQELRNCYEDYLYNNTKLAELIMTESHYGNGNHNHDDPSMVQDSIQRILRRRSITPPPEYGRMDSMNHLRTITNGSTSTIASLISSNSSQSTNSSVTTNSSNSSSSIFRTHRFIPNIISHQAQKMAQHFELKKFRSSNPNVKKDSVSSLKHEKTTAENQTMLSFLFGLSSSGASLKRSESANNIHRINHILLPKHYMDITVPSLSSSMTSNQTFLSSKNNSKQYRKHSMNNGTTNQHSIQKTIDDSTRTTTTFDSQSNCSSSSKSIRNHANSKSNSPQSNSPKHQQQQKTTNVIMTNVEEQPPPLPPKTYNRTNGISFNNSGRSSIASNTSTVSSSPSLTSTSTSSSINNNQNNNNNHKYHKSKDSDSVSGSVLPSNSSSEFQKCGSTVDCNNQQKSSTSTNTNSMIGSIPNVSGEISGGASLVKDISTEYSQVTLRPKKTGGNRTMINNNKNGSQNQCVQCYNNHHNNSKNNSNDHRSSSPPPLPPPDSIFCCSSIVVCSDPSSLVLNDNNVCCGNIINNNSIHSSNERSANSLTNIQNYHHNSCCCAIPSSAGPRQIRTYRRPSEQTNNGQKSRQTMNCSDSIASSLVNSSLEGFCFTGNYCCPSLISTTTTTNECCNHNKNHQYRMPTLSTNICDSSPSSLIPPPLPPKRNLHAYMGMVGNYTGLSSPLEHQNLRATKSMFCKLSSNMLSISANNNQLHKSSTSIISLSSSISTTASSSFSTNSSTGSPRSLTLIDHGTPLSPSQISQIYHIDQYEHLPIAPPPPQNHSDQTPSPPPILPPRRDKVGDLPPPPVHSRSIANRLCCHSVAPRTSTPINVNLNLPHPHHHCHCHQQPSPIVNCQNTKEQTEKGNNLLESDLKFNNKQQQIMEGSVDVQELEESDNKDNVDETQQNTCCSYCSEGTIHSEDECILTQIDVSSEMFSFESDHDGSYHPGFGGDSSVDMIRGGTIDALLIKATQASLNSDDEAFVDCFLTTYRSFITVHDLLRKLIFRYCYFINRASNTTDIVQKSVARKVVTFIILLIEEIYIYDFDKTLMETMMEFIYQLVTKGDLVNAKFLREKCYEKLRLKEKEFRHNQLQQQQHKHQTNNDDNNGQNDTNNNNNHHASTMAIIKTTTTTMISLNLKTWTLLDFKAEHLAEQMTLLDSRLFYKIELPEILIWAKEQKEESIPNLSTFTEHFNNMSYWARSQILKCQEQRERDKYMLKFLKIMKYLRKLNNFNSYLAILSALDCAPISRLDWPKNVTDMIKEYGSLIDSSSSFRTYRNILANSKPPCIPYIGLILQDLTFVHIGNSDILPDGKINWCKYYKQFKILCQMRQFKQCKYSIAENENILSFFDDFKDHLQEDVMWQISDSLKPRITTSNINSNNSLITNDSNSQ